VILSNDLSQLQAMLMDASLDIYMQNTHISRFKKGVKLVAIPS
jgi:hypothetical protein